MTLAELEQQLEQQHELITKHGEEIDALKVAMNGTADKPGIFETNRSMKLAVDALNVNLMRLTASVDKLARDRLVFGGVITGVGLAGGIIGWLLNNIIVK